MYCIAVKLNNKHGFISYTTYLDGLVAGASRALRDLSNDYSIGT